MSKPVRLADIADEVGVSLMTVSRILSDRGRYSAEVTHRVLESARRLGYKPNLAARQLAGKKSNTIGLIVPYLSDLFFKQCVYAVQETARANGLALLVLAHNRQATQEREAMAVMLQRQVGGLLVVPAGGPHQHFEELKRRGVPFVAFDVRVDQMKSDVVLVDNADATAEAIKHLMAHGHRRIAFLGTELSTYSMGIRCRSYAKTIREAGLSPIIAAAETALSGGETDSLFRKVLSGPKRPTAVFTVNSICTVRALLLLEDLGLSVPEDVALIGFDDFEFAPLLKPQLTAVRQPAEELGHRAVQRLIDRMNGDATPPAKIVLKAELVARGSCGCEDGDIPMSRHSPKARKAGGR